MFFSYIYLFHGKGGRPTGSVLQLEELLRRRFQQSQFIRPALLHGDPEVTAQQSLAALREMEIPRGAAIVGISLGGLVAAKLQEMGREDLHVICVSSPTWADEVRLTQRVARRVALYSSTDNVIEGRTASWPQLAQAYDLPWLTHDTDVHKLPLSHIIASYLDNDDVLLDIVETEKAMRREGVLS